MQSVHHEVDGAAMCVAGEASVGVATGVECQTGVVVVVKGTEALVTGYAQAEALSHSLDGERAKTENCIWVHDVK